MKTIIHVVLVALFLNSCKIDKNADVDYRPAYHFTADSNWINDPNGLVYYNGEYHLFYQYNPFGNKWGHMSWGHSVSKDLMNWEKLDVALYEDKNINDTDSAMIFSGSAVMDVNNTSGFGTKENPPMVAVYTSFVHGGRNKTGDYIEKAQSQSIAYSTDKGRTWTKYAGNPVLDIHSMDYRDPKVFWYEPEQKWVLSLVKSDRQEVWFYESKNLKEWNYMSRWGRAGNTATVWECPDLFEIAVEGTNEKKWVLLVSAGHPTEKYPGMQYFVGHFDGKNFTPSKNYQEADYLDFGKDFYAAVSYNDAPDNRRIIVGWLNNWIYAREIPTGKVWRGAFSVPRELSVIKTGNEYKLIQKPVAELTAKQKEVFKFDKQSVDSTFNLTYKGSSYVLEVTIEPGTAKKSGIKIFKGDAEETSIYYDKESGMIFFDRTKSGNIEFSNKFSSIEKAPVLLKDNAVTLKILVDKCIAEVFINDGETIITNLVFPKENAGGIQLFSTGGRSNFKDVKIYSVAD